MLGPSHHTHTHTHTRTHARTHTRTHARTHTHTVLANSSVQQFCPPAATWLDCIFLIHLYLAALGLPAVPGLSLVAVERGCSSFWCAGLLLGLASLVVEHGHLGFRSCGTRAWLPGGIFPGQASNLCPQHWQADSQPLGRQGRSGLCFHCQPWAQNARGDQATHLARLGAACK